MYNVHAQPTGTMSIVPTLRTIGNAIPKHVLPHETFYAVNESGIGQNPRSETEAGVIFTLKIDDPWFPKADLRQAKNVIVYFNNVARCVPSVWQARNGQIAWPLADNFFEHTDFDLSDNTSKIDDETAQFIGDHELIPSVAWVQVAAPAFFDGADFEIRVLPAADGENNLLALKVYGTFAASEFRDRRHRLCRAMVEAGYKDLHEIISVFQRQVSESGWKAISCYRSLSAE